MNTRVDCIAKRQACLGGFVESPSPPLEASKDDDDSDDDDNDKDGDAIFSSAARCLLDTLTLCHS